MKWKLRKLFNKLMEIYVVYFAHTYVVFKKIRFMHIISNNSFYRKKRTEKLIIKNEKWTLNMVRSELYFSLNLLRMLKMKLIFISGFLFLVEFLAYYIIDCDFVESSPSFEYTTPRKMEFIFNVQRKANIQRIIIIANDEHIFWRKVIFFF